MSLSKKKKKKKKKKPCMYVKSKLNNNLEIWIAQADKYSYFAMASYRNKSRN